MTPCFSLQNPNYIPTFWSSNKWANLCLYFVKQLYDKSALQSNKYLRELVDLPDGGTVAIDYIDDKNLKHDAPVVIFLHTITGSGLVKYKFDYVVIGFVKTPDYQQINLKE